MAMSEKRQTAAAPTPVELLAGESWSFAFFTTYALSLTFFESVVLRELRRVGCEEVWIFVDADGYRASLAERRAFRVGQEYRVIPISMPRGVFHPKCTFLASAKSELLLIGSGNITFGGFGRNLEVLEVIHPRSAPALMRQFAGFVDALVRRSDLQIPDRSGLRRLAQLVATASNVTAAREPDNVRILHSCDSPILQGIREAAEGLGDCRRLTVLSPYFDTSGNAIKALAEAVQAEEVIVALPPGTQDVCGFPFASTRKWKCKVSAAMPDLTKETRPLHAKWFEAEFQRGVLTLTGSVNATWPALCTTDNIELGVLRISRASGTWIRWVKTPIPRTTSVEQEREERTKQPVLYAQLEAGGQLRGTVLARSDVEGRWEATLSDAADQFEVFNLAVDKSGGFSADVPKSERFAFASALQLTLEKAGKSVRGWVHQEDILRMPRLRRLGITSLLRLINRQETEDDDVALLDYLSLSANKHLGVFSHRIAGRSGTRTHSQVANGDSIQRLSNIAPSSDEESSELARPHLSDSSEAILERVFAQLRQRMVRREAGREDQDKGLAETEEDEQDEKSNKSKKRHGESTLLRVLGPAIERFEDGIRRGIDRAEDEEQEDERRALLVIWFEVKQHMLLGRLNRRDQGFEFTKEWLTFVTDSASARSELGPLEQYVFTGAALCSLLAPEEGRSLLRARLHEDLERFCGRSVDSVLAFDALLSGEHVSFVALLIGSSGADLRAELDAILQTKTVRQQLEEAYEAYSRGSPVPPDMPVFQAGIGARLYEAMCAKGRPLVKALRERRSMCAHDYLALEEVEERQLQRRRIVQCVNCKRFTIQLAP